MKDRANSSNGKGYLLKKQSNTKFSKPEWYEYQQNYSNTYTYKDRDQRKYNNEINLYNYQTERSINRRRYPRNYHIEHKENYHQTGNYKFNYISCISKMHREC